jgi:hypothetical protein
MTVIINGTTGITNVNGTAAAPAETGTDTDSGIVYGTNTVSLATNGTTALTVDASQNVGIGTSSPSSMSGTGIQVGASSIFENVVSSQTLVGGNAYYSGSAWKAVRTQTGYAAIRLNAVGPGVTSFHQNVASYTAGDTLTAMDTTDVRVIIDASGNLLITNVAGLGYGTGSGGTVTQATSKSTGVTLNKPAGQITMNNAALAAGATATFRLDNSLLSAQDVLTVSLAAADPSATSYQTWVNYTAGGAAYISLKNVSGGSRSEAIIINFALIKVATS